MEHDTPVDEDSYTIGIAVFFCFWCLYLIYLATQQIALRFHNSCVAWLLVMLITVVPVAINFIFLYSSGWHHGWPKYKRVSGSLLVSCVVLGASYFIACWMAFVIWFFCNVAVVKYSPVSP